MAAIDLYELKTTLNREDILICFAGPFSHSIIEELGMAVKRYLEAEQITRTSLMKVFSVFVEQAQNVKNYAERKAASDPPGEFAGGAIVVIGRSGDRYVVSSGNVAAKSDIAPVLDHLEHLRGLDGPGLKALYKEQLRRGGSEEGNAGLGLIDMARNASEPLEASLRDIDDENCFFSLKAVI